MYRIGFYTGTFDPVTNGHVDVIAGAVGFCDRLVVGVGANPGKTPIFPPEERIALITATCAPIAEARGCELVVETFEGLAVVAARRAGARLIIRGIRSTTDFDYEMAMAGMNSTMAPEVRTIFLPASGATRHITASLVREIASMGGDVTPFVPKEVVVALREKLARR